MKNENTPNNSLLNNSILEDNKAVHFNTVNSNEHSNIDISDYYRYEIPGYDTVCYWVEQSDVPEMVLLEDLSSDMDEMPKENRDQYGNKYLSGTIKGLKVDLHQNGINIRVSLPKFLLGNNIESIFLDEVKKAHEQISEILGFSIYKARVYRIDLASTFLMLQPFKDYIFQFLSKPRFYSESDKNGLYYFNCKKISKASTILAFYNKIQEQLKNGKQVDESILNTFRYEIRFRKFKRSIDWKEVRPIDLENITFFKHLVDRWVKHFNKILFNTEINPAFDFLDNSKTFTHFLTSKGIRSFGSEKLIKLLNDQIKMEYLNKQKGDRFKRKINDLLSSSESTIENELIKELKGKMNNAHLYYSETPQPQNKQGH